MTDPSLVHDMVGVGFPLALQDKVTFCPSIFVAFWGCFVISAATKVTNKQVKYPLQDRFPTCIWQAKPCFEVSVMHPLGKNLAVQLKQIL